MAHKSVQRLAEAAGGEGPGSLLVGTGRFPAPVGLLGLDCHEVILAVEAVAPP
eukprot:CAMPEP_0197890472 /NCGR_PEP_ID=MMETSP1439-20131203/26833_1 /TAXON_ID=66791 /ORGANISM="Gonyaulax spinifera, Strain CCMP409" /LENGTH=52 /DNA_ID=CAMNT_0043510513 /DNA_START=55 /DNA_END=210 /DNA_ORIENTATION=-